MNSRDRVRAAINVQKGFAEGAWTTARLAITDAGNESRATGVSLKDKRAFEDEQRMKINQTELELLYNESKKALHDLAASAERSINNAYVQAWSATRSEFFNDDDPSQLKAAIMCAYATTAKHAVSPPAPTPHGGAWRCLARAGACAAQAVSSAIWRRASRA